MKIKSRYVVAMVVMGIISALCVYWYIGDSAVGEAQKARLQAAKKLGLERIVDEHMALEQAFDATDIRDLGEIARQIATHINFWREQMTEQIIFSDWQPKTGSDHLLLNMVADVSQFSRNYYLYQKTSFEQTAIAVGTLCETDLWVLLEKLMNHSGSKLDDLLLAQDSERLLVSTIDYLNGQLEDVRQDVAQTKLPKDQKEALHLFKTISTAKPDLSLPKITLSTAPSVAPLKTQKIRLKDPVFADYLGNAKWMRDFFMASEERLQLLSYISALLVEHSDEVIRLLLAKLIDWKSFDQEDLEVYQALMRKLIISERSMPWIMSFAEKSPKHAAFLAKLILDKLTHVAREQYHGVDGLVTHAEQSGIQDTKRLKALLVKRILNAPNLSWLKAKQLDVLKQAVTSNADSLDNAFDAVEYWQDRAVDDLFLSALGNDDALYQEQIYSFIYRHQGSQHFFAPDSFEGPDGYQKFIQCLKKMGDCKEDLISMNATAALGSMPSEEAEKILFECLNADRVSVAKGAIIGLRTRYINSQGKKPVFRKQSFLTSAHRAQFIERLISRMVTVSDQRFAWEIALVLSNWPDKSVWQQVMPEPFLAAKQVMQTKLLDQLLFCIDQLDQPLHAKLCDTLFSLIKKSSNQSLQLSVIKLLGKLKDERAEEKLLHYMRSHVEVFQIAACEAFRERYLKPGSDYYQPSDFTDNTSYQQFYEWFYMQCLAGNHDLQIAAIEAIRHYQLNGVENVLKRLTSDYQARLKSKDLPCSLVKLRKINTMLGGLSEQLWELVITVELAKVYHPSILNFDDMLAYFDDRIRGDSLETLMRTQNDHQRVGALLNAAKRYNRMHFEIAVKILLTTSWQSRFKVLTEFAPQLSNKKNLVMVLIDLLGKQPEFEAATSLMALFDKLSQTMSSRENEAGFYERHRLKDECIDARRTWSPRLAILHRLFDRKTDTVKAFMTRVSGNKNYRKEVQALAQRYLSQ